MTQTALGTVRTDGEVVELGYERELRHPPEKVWRAITESEHLRHWFPADIVGERVAGADLRFVFWPEAVEKAADEIESTGVPLDDPSLPGRMITWEPPRLLELTWDTEHLRFDLEPVEGGTRLRLTVRATPRSSGCGLTDPASSSSHQTSASTGSRISLRMADRWSISATPRVRLVIRPTRMSSSD